MNTLKWLAVFGALAVALAGIMRLGLGPFWPFVYLPLVFAVTNYLLGRNDWIRTMLAAVTAATVGTVFSMLL